MKGMREKALIAGIAILGLAVAYGQRQTPTPVPGEIGRYQLRVATLPNGELPYLYRIDTRTGRTWLEPVVSDGQIMAKWSLIREGQDTP